MAKKSWMFGLALLILTGCSSVYGETAIGIPEMAKPESKNGAAFQESEEQAEDCVTEGTERYRDFVVDSVLHSRELGDIHYCITIPRQYDGSEPYSLYITLPGYQGLYFQGAAMNLRTEEFAFEAQKYDENMIIVAPQFEDWGEVSAQKTIALTEYLLSRYNIRRLYEEDGLSEEEMDTLVALDVKSADYFTDRGVTNQHGGGGLFCRDNEIMGWLFETEHPKQRVP